MTGVSTVMEGGLADTAEKEPSACWVTTAPSITGVSTVMLGGLDETAEKEPSACWVTTAPSMTGTSVATTVSVTFEATSWTFWAKGLARPTI